MAGTEGSYPSRERERGFRAALREAGLLFPENRMHVAGFSRERAQEITFELLGRNQLQPGSAVVCATDLLAIGTIPGAAPLRLPRTRRFCRDRRQRLLRRRGFLPEPHDVRISAEGTGGRRGGDAARPAAEKGDRAGTRTARQARAGGIRTAPRVNASPDRNGTLTKNTGQSRKYKLVYKQFTPHQRRFPMKQNVKRNSIAARQKSAAGTAQQGASAAQVNAAEPKTLRPNKFIQRKGVTL